MRNSKQADIKKVIEGALILTLLAWATQTLVSQWALGSEERFIAQAGRVSSVELKSEASVSSIEIRLSQIARWPASRGDAMDQTGDLIVGRFEAGKLSRVIDVDDVKTVLEGAGINLGTIDFSGALRCVVTRSDARLELALEQAATAAVERLAPTTRPGIEQEIPARPPRTLREILTTEVAQRFGMSEESLQIRFSAQDEKIVNLAEPHFKFEVEPRRARNIGDMTWDVGLVTAAGRQKVAVTANVRAWQTQVVAMKPIVARQVINELDVSEKRVLVDQLPEDQPLTLGQVVGQQVAREVSAGGAINGRLLEAVQLAKVGQLVNVMVQNGGVQLKWVAEARESGAHGQTIRVRKPGTREEFSVILTGPQQGKLVSASPGNVAVVK
jgi:flagella basal body P-ring formation protein FlgA